MEKKNTILLTVIAIATLLVAVVGATFAYFTASVTTDNAQNNQTKATTASLANAKMDMGSKLVATNALPGYKALKTVKVTGTCGNNQPTCDSINAKIVLKPTVTDFTGHVRYTVYKIATANEANGVTCTNIDTTTGLPKTGADYDTNTSTVDPADPNTVQYHDTVTCSANSATIVQKKDSTGSLVTAQDIVFVDGQNEEIPVVVSGGMADTYYVVIEYMNVNAPQDTEQGKTFTVDIDFVVDDAANVYTNQTVTNPTPATP